MISSFPNNIYSRLALSLAFGFIVAPYEKLSYIGTCGVVQAQEAEQDTVAPQNPALLRASEAQIKEMWSRLQADSVALEGADPHAAVTRYQQFFEQGAYRFPVVGIQISLRIARIWQIDIGDYDKAIEIYDWALATYKNQPGVHLLQQGRLAAEQAQKRAEGMQTPGDPKTPKMGSLVIPVPQSLGGKLGIGLPSSSTAGKFGVGLPTLGGPKTLSVAPPQIIISGSALGWRAGSDRCVTALAQQRDGTLWVATEDSGVWCYNPLARRALDRWQQFTAKNGLGDDSAYALAVDLQGRVWAGTLNHGVSVWNGQKWKNYSVLDGPLGERVFDIAICPTDGDVWLATNAGLTRYSSKSDSWSYFTRTDGLPSDQIQAIAFDGNGNIVIGTQCDGVALAQAANNYKNWRVVRGPEPMPLTAVGQGLPSSLINDVVVTRDGTIYAATTTGLAWSNDQGQNWNYVRGQNYAAKVQGLHGGAPAGWKKQAGAVLAEDYVSCLAEDEAGHIWLGHWQAGSEMVQMQAGPAGLSVKEVSYRKDSGFVKSILPRNNGALLLARYDQGLTYGLGSAAIEQDSATAKTAAIRGATALPSAAKAPTLDEIDKRIKLLSALSEPLPVGEACYEGDDWQTLGDWMGHYGRDYTVLCATQSPLNHYIKLGQDYKVEGFLGPHTVADDSLRHWIHWPQTENQKSLYNPVIGYRRQAEWDDHGETYAFDWEGPSIWTKAVIPEGVHRLSFYFVNKDGHVGPNRTRDYLIEAYKGTGVEDSLSQIKSLDETTPLIRGRVRDFWSSVYKSFVVHGPATYWVKLARNGSHNTILSAVMIDKITGPATWTQNQPLAYLGRYDYTAPEWNEITANAEKVQSLVQRARIWEWKLDAALGRKDGVQASSGLRVLALRALMNAPDVQMPPQLLERWRWKTHLWTDEDRQKWNKAMVAGRESWFEMNPRIRNTQW